MAPVCRARASAAASSELPILAERSTKAAVGLVAAMAENPIILALANPTPEIMPDEARAVAPDAIIATGRSDYPNQINNVLCFPGLFRGMLDVRASRVTSEMKLAAADAIANVIAEKELNADYIVPSVFDRRVAKAVAKAVAQAACDPVRNGSTISIFMADYYFKT